MARLGVVRPDTTRLALKEGDWIEVKKHLTAGEKARLSGAGLEGVRGFEGAQRNRTIELNYERLELARIEAYVVKWSFIGLDDAPLKVTPESIASLTQEIAKEIDEALDLHVKAMDAEKNGEAPKAEGGTS